MSSHKLSLSIVAMIVVPILAFSIGQKAYPTKAEIKDGIKTINNPEFPRDGRFKAKLILEMSWGAESEPATATLNTPANLRIDDQGLIYVMDWGDIAIKVFNERGGFLRTIGRTGQGPGEFMSGSRFDLMSGERICILDPSQRRIMILTTRGQYLSGFPLNSWFGDIRVDGQDRLFLGRRAVSKEQKSSTEFRENLIVTSIFQTDGTGQSLIHIADFQGEPEWTKSTGKTSAMGMRGVWANVWDVDHQGRIYGGYNGDYHLDAYDPEGKRAFSFGRLFTPIKNTRFKGPFTQMKYLPIFNPFFGQTIVFDEDGNLWIELFQDKEKGSCLYDVFSSDGIYLKQVQIEQRIAQFKQRMIYCIDQSEDGNPLIKRFRMELVPEVVS
jgi:hypothetical protein